MAYDAATGTAVLFGGYIDQPLSTTLTWNGSTWTRQHPATHPSARQDASMAYDAATRTVVLFGGCCSEPTRAIRCACAIGDAIREIGLAIRAGLHTGEIECRGATATGIAVHVGARVAALARPGEVLVTSTVKQLVPGSGDRLRRPGRAYAQRRR
jgi:class 3 adenylate cyclase